MQKGNKYLPGLGWVPTPAVEKAQNGEWFESGHFLPLADAEKVHTNLGTPWVLETENFTLKSTATRKLAVEMAERLESIRALCFRQYLEFFMRASGKRGAQLLFNQAAPQKMVVYYFGTKADFEATIRKEMKGRDQELLLRSAGFYDSRSHASYFYHDANFGSFQVMLMQHEVTHQILGEYAKGGSPPVWVCEGIAECLEPAKQAANGKLVLPRGLDHPSVRFAADALKKAALPAVSEMLGMSHEAFHDPGNRQRNYSVAGALCRCLLEIDDGAYAPDFLEYLYDSYRGAKASLADYIGMDAATLDKRFRQYLQDGR
jgi:hypothetical protein